MSSSGAHVHFEQVGPTLTAVEITRAGRRPVISSLHAALFALGVVVSSYQARCTQNQLVERIVIERKDGGAIDGPLNATAKAAILPLALA